MSAYEAVKVTIDLVHVPSRVRHQRSLPLPAGVPIVLGIAAGDEGALSEASTAIDRPRELIRKAAAFFIEQILLSPDADSYRVLGANRTATAAELRHNMALLIRFVHPDASQQDLRSIFAGRVTQAWEDLKTPERRAAYDKVNEVQEVKPRSPKRTRSQRPFKSYASRRSFDIWEDERRGLLRRAMSLLLGGIGRPRR
jgi:hypothetical protein